MLYLYAITDHPESPLPPIRGLDVVVPVRLSCGEIAAVVSPVITSPPLPTETNLWRHEAVIETLMADRAVLPVRFGTTLPDEVAVQTALSARYADWVTALARVRGHVELGLRILWNDDFPITDRRAPTAQGGRSAVADSGRAYLLARLEEERQVRDWQQRAQALAMILHTPLARMAAESTCRVLLTPRLLLTAAYLVERSQIVRLRQAVETLGAAHPALSLLCTGPWPPYNFIGVGEEHDKDVHA